VSSNILSPYISLLFSFSNLSTRSTNVLNINFFLPTQFLQPVNLAILTVWSLFNPLAVPAFRVLSPFLAHQPSPHWKLQIAHSDTGMHHGATRVLGINSQIHSISLASLVWTHLSIYLSAHLCHHYHSHHPSLRHSFTPVSRATSSTNPSYFNTSPIPLDCYLGFRFTTA